MARAVAFAACIFQGRGKYRSERAATLEGARALRDAWGPDRYGRIAVIYAITPEGWTIHVE